MFFYTVRRILATLPVMAVVALFVFSLLYLSPGDPAEIIAGDQATAVDVQRIRVSLGHDLGTLDRRHEGGRYDVADGVDHDRVWRSERSDQPTGHARPRHLRERDRELQLRVPLDQILALHERG